VEIATRIDELWAAGEIDAAPIEEAIRLLDAGRIRVAEPSANGWVVNEWVKKAILLYFRLRKVEPMDAGGLHFLDKIPVKSDYADRGVRVVPPGVARYGSFLSEGCVLMPGYVNIGAWVGPRTMVDTWATVGSCAQIGADVHLAGGVGIGGLRGAARSGPVSLG
jgi:2,3,4,5-tetrahydropyridine-2-carboxylate N-succinyltransferase